MVYAAITWIFVVAIFASILVGFGLGANDVANTFGPSVGAKALTMRQALLVAAIFEFLGAVLMGSGVTSTIRSGITNISYFYNTPDILAYGMLCALLAAGLWMLIATYWELPVSSTQSIVSGVAGIAIVAEGFDAVVWSASKDTFPYVKGMSAICTSWVLSPFLAGAFAATLFFFIRLTVLRSQNAYQRSLYLLPIFTFCTFFVVTYFVIAKAGLQWNWQKTPDSKKAWISAIVASGTCLISILLGIPYIKHRVAKDLEEEEKAAAAAASSPGKEGKSVKDDQSDEEIGQVQQQQGAEGAGAEGASKPMTTPARLQTMRESRIWKSLTKGMNTNIHDVVETDETIHNIHENVEVFDHKAETSFKYLQVCTACANAFSHGSNEVANAVGPLAAIYQIWRDTKVSSTANVPTWLLAVGGASIVLGLATWGYKVMRAMGVKLTRLSNSRGFSVELSVAAVVILASRYDLPNSTTPATVGAIAGVGLLEGRRGFNFRLLAKFVCGWIMTIVIVVCFAMAFTAQGIYAPNKTASDQRAIVAAYLNGTSNQVAGFLNTTGTTIGNETWLQQAQNITALTATQQVPVVDLIPPMDTQALALTYLSNNSGACVL